MLRDPPTSRGLATPNHRTGKQLFDAWLAVADLPNTLCANARRYYSGLRPRSSLIYSGGVDGLVRSGEPSG